MDRVEVFSPGHVTGLFYIADQAEDPLEKGSLGAGFSINKGVRTQVLLDRKTAFESLIYINNHLRNDAVVSERIISLFLEKTGISPPGKLLVQHIMGVPEGSGFGSSGAGALSLAVALNHLSGDPLSRIEAAQIAHQTEVECKTGLGTVMGETIGGLKILVKVGAPGIGETLPIQFYDDLTAVFLVYGPYSTRKALSDPEIRRHVIETGKKYHWKLKQNLTLKNFLEFSRNFAEETGLITERLRSVLEALDRQEIPASMLMFGEGIFSLVPNNQKDRTIEILKSFASGPKDNRRMATIFTAKIDREGVRVTDAD